MNAKEHREIFLFLQNAKIEANRVLGRMNSMNLDEIKESLSYYQNIRDEYQKYYNDHTLSGEMIDLSMAISKIKERIKNR